MKKIQKRLFCILALCFCLISVVSASATEVNTIEQGTQITQFYYIIYDKDGNIKGEGVTPSANERYTWSGITLSNGEYVKFLNANNRAFTIPANLRYDFIVSLNRKATMKNFLVHSTFYATEVLDYTATWTSDTIAYSRTDMVSQTAYYYFEIGNYSSDNVTINSVELLF